MKKSKAIALMLIGMIAFAHVGANYQPTTSEKATSSQSVTQKSYDEALPQLVLIRIFISPLTKDDSHQTYTRVKECKPDPQNSPFSDLPLKVGWC